MSSRYLSTKEAAEVLGVSTSTMALYIAAADGPKTHDIGRGRPRLRILEDDLHEWMKTRERAS